MNTIIVTVKNRNKIPVLLFGVMSIFALFFIESAPLSANEAWSKVATPLRAVPRVFGFYSAGCLAGAVALPLEGAGYRAMRPSRGRYYGHPVLIEFVENLARQAAVRNSRLLIGDLAQPRGGPMSYGHTSHQIGLDVDIWFNQEPARRLSEQEVETMPMLSMIKAAQGELDHRRWSPRYRDILKLAADAPQVQRIFVNPIIKHSLCRSEVDRAWLRKLRPWWGHHAHFHVRLHCPPDSSQCKPQKPPPTGDGCGEGVEQWVHEIQQAAINPPKKKKPKQKKPLVLPEVCGAVLQGPSAAAPGMVDPAPRFSVGLSR